MYTHPVMVLRLDFYFYSAINFKRCRCKRLAQDCFSASRRPGVEPAACWLQVQHPNHYATECLAILNCRQTHRACPNFVLALTLTLVSNSESAWLKLAQALSVCTIEPTPLAVCCIHHHCISAAVITFYCSFMYRVSVLKLFKLSAFLTVNI